MSLELVIKMSNEKERNNKKEVNTKCYLVTTKKCGPFNKIGDHKLYITKDLILTTNHKKSSCGLKLTAEL